jgi:hypothetical protein
MIRTRNGELMQTLSRIDDILDRFQNGRYIEMKAQTGDSDETNSSVSSYICPCTFMAVLCGDIANELDQVSIKHYYSDLIRSNIDFEVFNGYIEKNALSKENEQINWMDDIRTSVVPNHIVEEDLSNILQYRSEKTNTVFVNAFIILHHWARHDAVKGEHTDQLLWQTKHGFSPYDKFYQRPKLLDKHISKKLKSEYFTLTNCLKRWFYNLCDKVYSEISFHDHLYQPRNMKDIQDRQKKCEEKRRGFDDFKFKAYFEKRFEKTERMESMLRQSINELNSLLTGAGNKSNFPDPVYAAVGREGGTGIYRELIARARIIFKNSVLAAFPSSCFTKYTNIDRMVSELGVIDVEPFVEILMDEFNALCIPKELMSIYSDLYGVIREWIVGLVPTKQKDRIRTEFIEFVGYSDEKRYDHVKSSQLETFIKEKIFEIISVWRDDTVKYATEARQRDPNSDFSEKIKKAQIFPLFADQVNCLLRNCEFFLENKTLGQHCGSLYSIFHDSVTKALGDMNTDDIIKKPDSGMRWSLKREEIQNHMAEALLKSMSKPFKRLEELSIQALVGQYFFKGSVEYTKLKSQKTGKLLLPGQYGKGSIILINDRDGVGVASFDCLSTHTIYDNFDVQSSRFLEDSSNMRMFIYIPKLYYMMPEKRRLKGGFFTLDINGVEFVKIPH